MRVSIHQGFPEKLVLVNGIIAMMSRLRFRKMGSNFAHKFAFLMLNHKISKSKWLSQKNLDVKYEPKNTQILEIDFGKLQNWETSPKLSILKFQGLYCCLYWLIFDLKSS